MAGAYGSTPPNVLKELPAQDITFKHSWEYDVAIALGGN